MLLNAVDNVLTEGPVGHGWTIVTESCITAYRISKTIKRGRMDGWLVCCFDA